MTRPSLLVVAAAANDGATNCGFDAAVRAAIASGSRSVTGEPGWAILTNHPTMAFNHSGGGRSLVIGRARGERLSAVDLDHHALDALGDEVQAAKELISAIWGEFIAVIRTREGLHLIGDPAGALPFDLVQGSEASVACDDLSRELCSNIGHHPRPDWPALAKTLVVAPAAVHLAHLVGTRPAIPGRLYRLGDLKNEVTIWSPAQVASRPAETDPARLRQAVDAAAGGLDGGDCVMQLSGGLDSSIVLSTFCGAPKRPVSVTVATSAAGGDERRFAAIAAQACRSRLIERRASELPSYRSLFAREQGAHPAVYGLDDVFERTVTAVARSEGRNVLITGQGGDAVFFQPKTPLVAVDRARALGLGPGSLRPLMDDARRAGTSVWHQLLPALIDRVRRARVPSDRSAMELLTPAGRKMFGEDLPRHPWVADARALPPGKRMQIEMIANCQIFHSRRPDPSSPRLAHPLLSKPVLEAVLPIPVYELARGTNDRGMAREAFRRRLPAEILERRVKGEATDHYSRGVVADLPLLREMLLDGVMVRQGIVDRTTLERILTREHLFYSLDYLAIAMLASCEAWARYWTSP